MKSAVIRIEIQFEKRVPRKLLEELVMMFTDMKPEILAPLKQDDPHVVMRVWYDRFDKPHLKPTELLPRPKIRGLSIFKRKKKVKKNVQ